MELWALIIVSKAIVEGNCNLVIMVILSIVSCSCFMLLLTNDVWSADPMVSGAFSPLKEDSHSMFAELIKVLQ